MFKLLRQISSLFASAAMVVNCGYGWKPAPPDEATRAPKDGTPVVKINPIEMGLTVSVNTDSEIESYVIDQLTVNGVEPLEMPIIVGGLLPGTATRKFLKVDRDKFNTNLSEPGAKPWKLHRKVVWKSGKVVEDNLSGTINYTITGN